MTALTSMGWFKKKRDPLSDRARALTEEIAALEAQIKQLANRESSAPSAPRLRSTALPHGAAAPVHAPAPPAAAPVQHEPIFEEVGQDRLAKEETAINPEHYNDLGVRKYDLAAFFRRIKNHFRGSSTMNPKLVNYLAAGSIQGLRPMRYEKRVYRNRVLFIFVGLLALLVGLFVVFARNFR